MSLGSPRVPGVSPDGTPITLPVEKVEELQEAGGRQLTPQEGAQIQGQIDRSLKEDQPVRWGDPKAGLAGFHAHARGIGEAFGVPVDKGITEVADLFGGAGARKSTADYLASLDEENPLATKISGFVGNVGGAVAAAEVSGARAILGGLQGAGGLAARAGAAGVENLVQTTSHDINEAALGDHAVNGDKLVAAAPGRFLMGAAIGGAFEGVGHAIGKGYGAFAKRAAPALDDAASRAVGAEVGDVAAGGRIQALSREHGGVDIPADRSGLSAILEAEQGAQRGRSAATHAGTVDALAGEQASEAARLSARHEAERMSVLAGGKRSVGAAEAQGAESTLDAMARGGARVEEAELSAAARRSGAGKEAFDANLASSKAWGQAGHIEEQAGALVRTSEQLAEHYGILRRPLQEEEKIATAALAEITAEKAAAARELKKAIREAGKGANRKLSEKELETIARIEASEAARDAGEIQFAKDFAPTLKANSVGPQVGDSELMAQLRSMHAILDERAANTALRDEVQLGAGASEAARARIERFQKISESLDVAHEEAAKHAAEIKQALREVDSQHKSDLAFSSKPVATNPVLKSTVVTAEKADKTAKGALENLRRVEAEGKTAVEKARLVGEKEASVAQKKADKAVEAARAESAEAHQKFEGGAKYEKDSLASAHEKQIKKLPKAETKTDVDPLIAGMKRSTPEAQPAVSGNAALGSLFSVLHGNPVAAAAGLAASFAAGRARAIGNLTRARAMVSVAKQITRVDQAITEGAALVLGGHAANVTTRATNLAINKHEKLPSFDVIAEQVRAQQANPDLMERNVRSQLGELAEHAPQTYAGAMLTTQRANAYLASILPEAQVDPNSLTPQLEKGAVSETAQWDFMQSYRTINDPLSIFKDVHDGSVTESQIGALAAVYEPLYGQIREEINIQRTSLTRPVDYDRAIHVGQLMGIITDEVLERDFQRMQLSNFREKTKQGEAVGSKSGAVKSNKNMMSASQSIEGGEVP